MTEARESRSDLGDSVARNAAFAFAGQILGSLATAALTLYLVRALAPRGYGILSLAISIGTLLLLPGDFGLSNSTARFIAERRGQWPVIGSLVRDALRLKLWISGVLSAALFASASLIASVYGSPALTWPLRAIAIVIFAQSFMMLFTTVFVALGRVSINLRIVSTESFVEAGTATALVLLGAGAAGAAFGRAIGYSAAAIVGFLLARKAIGAQNMRRDPTGESSMGRIGRYASALLIIDSTWALLGPSATLIIGLVLSSKAVGLASAPIRAIWFLHYPGLSIAAGIAPRMARGVDGKPDVPALLRGLRLLTIIQTVLVAPTIVWAHPITALVLGPGYGRSADFLIALAPMTFVTGFGPLLSLSINYLGETRRRIPISITALVMSVVLNYLLISSIGFIGSAIAQDITYVFYVVAHLALCKSLVGLPLRPVLRDLSRCLVAVACMSAVLLLFGTHELPVWQLVVGGAAALGAYVGGLLITGAVGIGELRHVWQMAAAKVRPRATAAAT